MAMLDHGVRERFDSFGRERERGYLSRIGEVFLLSV